MLQWTQSMEEKVWDYGGLCLQSLERLENITRVMIMRPVPIDHLIMDIDMDAGIMATIMDMGASLAAIKAAAVWISGGGHVRKEKETYF